MGVGRTSRSIDAIGGRRMRPIALQQARPYAQAGKGYVVLTVDLRIHS
jgi:hypothetical protein